MRFIKYRLDLVNKYIMSHKNRISKNIEVINKILVKRNLESLKIYHITQLKFLDILNIVYNFFNINN